MGAILVIQMFVFELHVIIGAALISIYLSCPKILQNAVNHTAHRMAITSNKVFQKKIPHEAF